MQRAVLVLSLVCLALPLAPLDARAGQVELKAKPTKRSIKQQIGKLQAASVAIRELAKTPAPKGLTDQQLEVYTAEMATLTELAAGTDAVIRKLESDIDKPKNDLDSLSEMGEMESLRLQMAMDRLSKLMSTLSNLLKKQSDTAQTITQNLK